MPINNSQNNNLPEEYIKLLIEASVETALTRFDQKLNEQTKNFVMSAFPEGDLHGHRLAHEKMIERAKKCRTWKEEMWGRITTVSLMAAVGWLVLALAEDARASIAQWLGLLK